MKKILPLLAVVAGLVVTVGLAAFLGFSLLSSIFGGSSDAVCRTYPISTSANGIKVQPIEIENTKMSQEQIDNAQTVINTGINSVLSSDVPEDIKPQIAVQAVVIGLATALQESRLECLPASQSDRDSLCIFQQRPSTGWGLPSEIMDPQYATNAFYNGTESGNSGLLDIGNWWNLPVTVAAQAVQRSGFPEAYAQWEDEARALIGGITTVVLEDGDGKDTIEQQIFQSAACTNGVSSEVIQLVISAAESMIGKPYSWGGGDTSGPTLGVDSGADTVGFDCSGLVEYSYGQAGINLSGSAQMQYDAVDMKVDKEDLIPGDLVFWKKPSESEISHVAIWIGNDEIIEAPRPDKLIGKYPMRWDDYFGAVRPAPGSSFTGPDWTAESITGWQMPFQGNVPISSDYGDRLHPVLGRWSLHDGIDFGLDSGTPLYSMTAGIVHYAGYDFSWGHNVIFEYQTNNGKIFVRYAHLLEEPSVVAGNTVRRGQLVGKVGSTGYSTGAHLHLAFYMGGTNKSDSFDPKPLLRSLGLL